MIRRLLLATSALILSWAGVVQPGVGALASPSEFVQVYAHDGHQHTAVPTFTTTERGPPTTYDSDAAQSSDDTLPLGALARPEGTTSAATTTYDTPTGFAQSARASVTTPTGARANAGGLSALTRSAVAAKAGSSKVNPLGGTQNCVNCVIAGDNTLAGSPTSALDSAGPQLISRIEQHFRTSFKPVGGQSDITDILANAGPGARGIVFGARGSDPGHVFNAINQGGVVRYIDFQTGRAASFNGYRGFSFLRTN